jgi:hypothetical protein
MGSHLQLLRSALPISSSAVPTARAGELPAAAAAHLSASAPGEAAHAPLPLPYYGHQQHLTQVRPHLMRRLVGRRRRIDEVFAWTVPLFYWRHRGRTP